MAPDFDLLRFLEAQNTRHSLGARFENALSELRSGRKKTSWQRFVFPSVVGTNTATERGMRLAIRSYREAQAYYLHPVLGPRLEAATQAALDSGETDAVRLFGGSVGEAAKVKSCLTLFANVEAVLGDTRRFFRTAALRFWRDFDEDTLRVIGAFDDYPGPFKKPPSLAKHDCDQTAEEPPTIVCRIKRTQTSHEKPIVRKKQPWKVNAILASRVNDRGELIYQVDWMDGRDDSFWYPAAGLKYAAEQLVEYHDENPDQPGPPCRLDTWWRDCGKGRDSPSHPDDNQPALNRFRSGRARVPRWEFRASDWF